MSHFNFIITCHNSEVVGQAIRGALNAGDWKHPVLCVLDAPSEEVRATFKRAREVVPHLVSSIETDNVHELLAVNAGLRASLQREDGYNIIVQDDVILDEPRLTELIEKLYAAVPKLGYVSLRLAVDYAHDDGTRAFMAEMHNLESIYGAGCTTEYLEPYAFAYRAMPIKSPVCLPCRLVREVGLFNEELAPYAYDDAEYSLRAMAAGFVNGLFSVPLFSDYRWGGTRKPGHPDILPIAQRNTSYIRNRWQGVINQRAAIHSADVARRDQRIQIAACGEEQRARALEQWRSSQKLLADVEHGVIKLGSDAGNRASEMLHKNQGF